MDYLLSIENPYEFQCKLNDSPELMNHPKLKDKIKKSNEKINEEIGLLDGC